LVLILIPSWRRGLGRLSPVFLSIPPTPFSKGELKVYEEKISNYIKKNC